MYRISMMQYNLSAIKLINNIKRKFCASAPFRLPTILSTHLLLSNCLSEKYIIINDEYVTKSI